MEIKTLPLAQIQVVAGASDLGVSLIGKLCICLQSEISVPLHFTRTWV